MPDKKNLVQRKLQNMILYRSLDQIFLFHPDEGVNSLTVLISIQQQQA